MAPTRADAETPVTTTPEKDPPTMPDTTNASRLLTRLRQAITDERDHDLWTLWCTFDNWMRNGGAPPDDWVPALQLRTDVRAYAAPAEQFSAGTMVVPLMYLETDTGDAASARGHQGQRV